ncbi:MAG: hypothetical protein EB059_10980 [Alphaproteobacteria bacterium]|nr:hypothetical protein [Alphaproteobacteria bacterium]
MTYIPDSSIWRDAESSALLGSNNTFIRIGIIKRALNEEETGELRYLVEIQDHNKKININCALLRRFGGIYNYEDYVGRGYKYGSKPENTNSYTVRAGDVVLIGQINGQGRDGVILGGLTHPARETTLDVEEGPQYESEFNGINTSINSDGEWTLTFKGQPTNLDALDNEPSAEIPPPEYDTEVGSSFLQFDKTGGFTISDNAASGGVQTIFVDKESGSISLESGEVSLKLEKEPQQVSILSKTIDFTASETVYIKSEGKIYIGSDAAEEPYVLGNQLKEWSTELIKAILAIKYLGNLGAPVTGTLNAAEFSSLISKLDSILSKKVYGE